MSNPRPGLRDRLFVGMQYLLPQHLLARAMFRLARLRLSPVKNLLIRAFLSRYEVNLAESERERAEDYDSFNDFFTRALKPGARSVDEAADAIVSPVDGTVSQAGSIHSDLLVQAKGIQYSTAALLGGDEALAAHFNDGTFATIYLAPYNYHRIHMPLAGSLKLSRFVPGDLFSVNATTASAVPGLFARNERVCCLFDTDAGPMAVVLVGALFVGSMSLAWSGEIRPQPGRRVLDLPMPRSPTALAKAAELGRFNMGSTVIMLFGPGAVQLSDTLRPGSALRMGERIAVQRR
jgi:phosphatidylserine decarboxylase